MNDTKPGTVRGPYTCGIGNDATGGVQFAIRLKNGSWAYVIKPKQQEREARSEAEERARKERVPDGFVEVFHPPIHCARQLCYRIGMDGTLLSCHYVDANGVPFPDGREFSRFGVVPPKDEFAFGRLIYDVLSKPTKEMLSYQNRQFC